MAAAEEALVFIVNIPAGCIDTDTLDTIVSIDTDTFDTIVSIDTDKNGHNRKMVSLDI